MAVSTTVTITQSRKGSYLFSIIPGLDFTQVFFRASGKHHGEIETKAAINPLHEVEKACDLIFDLREGVRLQIA